MPYTTKELLNNEYFQSLVNADEKEYELKRDSAMVKANITGSNTPFEIDGVLQSYEDVRTGLGLEQPDQYIQKPMMMRNHNMENDTLDEVIDRDFTLQDKPFLKIPDGTFIRKESVDVSGGWYKFCLYQDDMKFPVKNIGVLNVYGKEREDILAIPDDMYNAITLGPKIDGSKLRNTDAIMGTHRDADFRTPLFKKPDEDALALVRERIKDGKSIVENLYQVTGQIAKSADQVTILAKSLLGEPVLPTAGDVARKSEMRQAEEDYNKQLKNEGVLERDESTLKRRDIVQSKNDTWNEIDDNLRKITGNSKRPAPVKYQGSQTEYQNKNNPDKIGF